MSTATPPRTTLDSGAIGDVLSRLKAANAEFVRTHPGVSDARQPVHTVYGGAHLFKADTARKMGELALASLREHAPDAATFARAFGIVEAIAPTIRERVAEKLSREPVEDFRLDFEDGFGIRPDAEEDHFAVTAAEEVAQGMARGQLSPFIGIRIKPFSEELYQRSIRTLDLFVTTLLARTGGKLPANFVVTYPKITRIEQVETLAAVLARLESAQGMAPGSLKVELMVETPQSIMAPDGSCALPALVAATGGRCTGAHFGTYDYTASLDITAAHQHMRHPACLHALSVMQVALANTGMFLSDGATNIMPVAPHRGEGLSAEQKAENRAVVHHAWRLHYDHTRAGLINAYYQGWDLHPAQLPSRYAAVFTFFQEGLEASSLRLRNFLEKAAQATLVGDVFDDAATGQGLLNYFLRGISCGALTEDEALATGITLEELRGRSFVKILNNRRGL